MSEKANIQIGSIGGDLSGAVGGDLSGNVAGGNIAISKRQDRQIEQIRKSVADEVKKGDKSDIQKILKHLAMAAKISTKALSPIVLGVAGEWVADLLE
jgi:hypothetical protein